MPQLDEIQNDLKQIKTALLGDEYNSNGLIQRVGEVEEYQKKDKKQKWMIAGGALVIGALSKFWKNILDAI